MLVLRHEELGRPRRYVFVLSLVLPDDEDTALDGSGAKSRTLPPSQLENYLYGMRDFVAHNDLLKRIYLVQFAGKLAVLAFQDSTIIPPIFQLMDKSNARYRTLAKSLLDEQIERLEKLETEYAFRALIIALPNVFQIYPVNLARKAAEYGYDLERLDISLPNKIVAKSLANHRNRLIDPTSCVRRHNADRSL